MAVFTHLNKDQIINSLTQFDVGSLTAFEGIAQGIDNTNYKIETTSGKYVLTIFESRLNPTDLPFFLVYMKHLVDNGITCPSPLPLVTPAKTGGHSGMDSGLRRNDVCIGWIDSKPAALFSFLEGRDVKMEDITPPLCFELGVLLGKMHTAGQSCPLSRPNSMSIPAWEIRLNKVGDAAKDFMPEIAFLKSNWPTDLPRGAIHADLFPDNVFIKDGHIYGVIDFYFAATDFLAYDLAIVLNAWCFDTYNQLDQERWKNLLSGYESIRPLTQPEKDAFPILSRGAAMRFLSSRLHDLTFHDPQALVNPKPPTEYIQKLDFHQHAKLF